VAELRATHVDYVWPFVCSNCRRPYPQGDFVYRCPECGGLYEFSSHLRYVSESGVTASTRSLNRYRGSFPLPDGAPLVSLGEGGTPLIPVDVLGRIVHFKCEYLNPTGSFKDRGTAVLVSALSAIGATQAVEDSSGNAGASFAAYAARAGIEARVFVPASASGPKISQIEAYGAQTVRVAGPRSAATEAAQREAESGAVYASHAYLPHGLAGMATMAYELVEQLQGPPGAVILPIGQGTLLLGGDLGFKALLHGGLIDRVPRWVGVQARACAPLWSIYTAGAAGMGWVSEGETIAEGIRIIRPLRGDAVLEAVDGSRGLIVAVDEPEILSGRYALSRLGLYVEPTSAVVWPALAATLDELPDPVVVVLTGSGYKTADPVARPVLESDV
jgi:threonine synthase